LYFVRALSAKLPGHHVGSVQGHCRTISYVSISRLVTRIVGTDVLWSVPHPVRG
jgi:hypothetical protein